MLHGFSSTQPRVTPRESLMLNSRFVMELITSILTAIIGLIVCFGSKKLGIDWSDNGPEAGFFPFYVGCIILIGSGGTLIQVVRSRAKMLDEFMPPERVKDVLLFGASVIAYAIVLAFVGLYVSMAIYLFLAILWKARLPAWKAAAIGIGAPVFFFIAFEYAFQLPLPKGPVLGWFGIY